MGLTAQLRSMDDERLAALLAARPDLVERPSSSFEQLAARAAAYGSQVVCLAGLDLFLQQLLQLTALAGSPTSLDRVQALAGPAVTSAEVAAGLRRLHDLGLVAFDPPSVRVVGDLCGRLGVPGLGRPARQLLSGRTSEELRRVAVALGVRPAGPPTRKVELAEAIAGRLEDPARVAQVLEAAPAEVARLLDGLDRRRSATVVSYRAFAYGPRPGVGADAEERAICWLAERGLLVQTAWGTGELVAEVGLARRGRVPFPDMTAVPPAFGLLPLDPGVDVAVEAGAAAARAVELLARLCHALDDEPAPLLKTGGLGMRPLRRLAAQMGLEEHDAATVVELAAAADLVSCAGGELQRGELSDAWSELDLVDRWLHVLRSWLTAHTYLRAAGSPADGARSLPPLVGAGGRSPEVARQRHELLEAVASMPATQRPDRHRLVAHLAWQAPQRWLGAPVDPEVAVAWFLDEAALVGATAHDVAAAAVRSELTADHRAARDAALRALPTQEPDVIVQADLTILALGSLDPRVAAGLGRLADIESWGAATVYRLSAASVARALRAGQSADDVVGFLAAHARSGVPQPVEVLVHDVARRYGRLRVGAAVSFLRCDDEALLAELVRHRKLAKLGLRQLAPSVAVSSAAVEVLLGAVAAAGYLPAEEDELGGLVVRRRDGPAAHRPHSELLAGPDAPPRPARPASAPNGSAPDKLTERVEHLLQRLRGRSAPTPVADPGSRPALTTDPARYPAILEAARADVSAVGLGVQEDGGTIDVVGTPLVVHDGFVALLCDDCDDLHDIPFDEIDWIELLDDRAGSLIEGLGGGPTPSAPTIGGAGSSRTKRSTGTTKQRRRRR